MNCGVNRKFLKVLDNDLYDTICQEEIRAKPVELTSTNPEQNRITNLLRNTSKLINRTLGIKKDT